MGQKKIPPRISILLASEAPIGLILRRGPSRYSCTIGWDREKDHFEIGQWLKGRIYEDHCDLSPDGKYFIYFAFNGKYEGEALGSWTAISRTPYLKAISLWPKGDCWSGGGLFLDNKKFWLNDESSRKHVSKFESDELGREMQFPGDKHSRINFYHLQRDGWTFKPIDQLPIFEKEIDDSWILKRIDRYSAYGLPEGKSPFFCYEHQLFNTKNDRTIDCAQWEWADLDRTRVVWAEEGKLFAGQMDALGIKDIKELYNFNDMQFEALTAPY